MEQLQCSHLRCKCSFTVQTGYVLMLRQNSVTVCICKDFCSLGVERRSCYLNWGFYNELVVVHQQSFNFNINLHLCTYLYNFSCFSYNFQLRINTVMTGTKRNFGIGSGPRIFTFQQTFSSSQLAIAMSCYLRSSSMKEDNLAT